MKKLENLDMVTVVPHSNLRNERWSFHEDDKHLAELSIAKFASNIKVGFRKAFGINNSKRTPGKHFNHKNNDKMHVDRLIQQLSVLLQGK